MDYNLNIALSDEKGALQEKRRYPFLSIVWKEDGSYRGLGSITTSLQPLTYYFVKTDTNNFIGYEWNGKKTLSINLELLKGTSDRIKIKIGENEELLLEKHK